MNSRIRKSALRIGLALLALTGMVTGMALPAAADTPQSTAVRTVQGNVTGIAPDGLSFNLQSGNQAPVVVKVTQSTWYLVVPLANTNKNGNGQKASEKNDDKNKQSRGKDMKDLRIPGNWKSDLGWLEVFRAAGTFSDIQVGDRITARVTADGTARQVLIVKAPAMQQVRGAISAISAGSITITTSGGTAVTLTSNANVKVSIKGYFVPQVGQNAIAVYNRNTMVAQTITIQTNQSPTVPPSTVTLTSLTVIPAAPANLAVGSTLQFTATATYSNSAVANVTSSATWASSNNTAATVVAGLALGIAAGSTNITAATSGVTSTPVNLNVIP